MDENDAHKKSVIDKLMDVGTTVVSEVAKAALPTGQRLMGSCWWRRGDCARGHSRTDRKPARNKRLAAPYRANRRVAAARARTEEAPAVETAPKKTAKKAAQKAAVKRPAPKKKVRKTAKQS